MVPKTIHSLLDIADLYDTFFVDMYGVVWDGVSFYKNVAPLFLELKIRHKKIVMLSNATTISSKFVQKYAEYGLVKGVHYDEFVTSGDVLKEKIYQGYFEDVAGKKDYQFYILGRDNPALFKEVSNRQTLLLQEADIMYVSSLEVDHQAALSLDKFLPDMEKALDLKLPLICANPDMFAFRGDLKYYRGGSVAKWYKERGGHVEYIGKPYKDIYEYALEKISATAEQSIMVGDTIGTDILGASNVHMDSVLIIGSGSMTGDDLAHGKTLDVCYKDGGATPQYVLTHI